MAEIQISFANGKIAFVKGNRDITVNKGLEKSIRLNGVMTPIQVVPYGAIKDWNIALVDPVSKEELEKPADDTYVVIDGQHRFLYALRAYNEAIKDEDPSGEHNMITDHISANVIDGARFKSRHPLTLISELNSVCLNRTGLPVRSEKSCIGNIFHSFRPCRSPERQREEKYAKAISPMQSQDVCSRLAAQTSGVKNLVSTRFFTLTYPSKWTRGQIQKDRPLESLESRM